MPLIMPLIMKICIYFMNYKNKGKCIELAANR